LSTGSVSVRAARKSNEPRAFHRLCVSTSRDPPIRTPDTHFQQKNKKKGLTRRRPRSWPSSGYHLLVLVPLGPIVNRLSLAHLDLGSRFSSSRNSPERRGDKHPLPEHNKNEKKGVVAECLPKTCRGSLLPEEQKGSAASTKWPHVVSGCSYSFL
jgi:hypothetical protein